MVNLKSIVIHLEQCYVNHYLLDARVTRIMTNSFASDFSTLHDFYILLFVGYLVKSYVSLSYAKVIYSNFYILVTLGMGVRRLFFGCFNLQVCNWMG